MSGMDEFNACAFVFVHTSAECERLLICVECSDVPMVERICIYVRVPLSCPMSPFVSYRLCQTNALAK